MLVGHFGRDGNVASWEADSPESFADPVLDLLTAPGRLYLRNAKGLQLAHVDPQTGRLLRWR